ncbi:hypothetical protein VNI00_004402 [Paramarasmius palmivorus]|uniref:Uncharacterized protein n=1 Tax=Paramarasmius palmivorus TaxID=297713 RepID=A0AAW0DKD9_9AGAR
MTSNATRKTHRPSLHRVNVEKEKARLASAQGDTRTKRILTTTYPVRCCTGDFEACGCHNWERGERAFSGNPHHLDPIVSKFGDHRDTFIKRSTSSLLPLLYRKVTITNRDTLHYYARRFSDVPFVSINIVKVYIRCRGTYLVRDPTLPNSLVDFPVSLGTFLRAVAASLEHLALEIPSHPLIVSAIRTTTFPRLRTLYAPHYLLLEEAETVRVYHSIGRTYRENGDNNNRYEFPVLAEADIVSSWPVLQELVLEVINVEGWADLPLPLTFTRLHTLERAAIILDKFDWESGFRSLQGIEIPANVEVVAIRAYHIAGQQEDYLKAMADLSYNRKVVFLSSGFYWCRDNRPISALFLHAGYRAMWAETWNKAKGVVASRPMDRDPFHHSSTKLLFVKEVAPTLNC